MSHKQIDLSGLAYYLRGYGNKNRDGLETIAEYRGWTAIARRELERRMEKVMESFPEIEVVAIANGDIDLNELASDVLADLDPE